MKRLKNTGVTALLHSNSGIYLAPSSAYTEVDEAYIDRCNDSQMWGWFNAGTVIFNDGTTDYTNKYEGYHRFVNYAFGTPFLSDPDRVNGFTKKNVQEAIEEARSSAEGLPRFAVRATYNSTLPNNQWLGPNELLPNTPFLIFPVKTKLNEISWSNQNTDRAFTIKFYKNGKLAGNLIYTLTVTSPNPGYGYVTGLSNLFVAGDVIYAYSNTTTAPSDVDLVLWLTRIL